LDEKTLAGSPNQENGEEEKGENVKNNPIQSFFDFLA